MSGCNKYVVIDLSQMLIENYPRTVEDFLNTQCECGLELVAVRGNEFIFKRNAYIASIKHIEDYNNDYESH